MPHSCFYPAPGPILLWLARYAEKRRKAWIYSVCSSVKVWSLSRAQQHSLLSAAAATASPKHVQTTTCCTSGFTRHHHVHHLWKHPSTFLGYIYLSVGETEICMESRELAAVGCRNSAVSPSLLQAAVRARGWLEPVGGTFSLLCLCYKCFAEGALSFSGNLSLNVDSLILLRFGIYFTGLCGSQKRRDYCQCTKQMGSARFHPFGSREIMLLEQQSSLPTQTGSKQKQEDLRGSR